MVEYFHGNLTNIVSVNTRDLIREESEGSSTRGIFPGNKYNFSSNLTIYNSESNFISQLSTIKKPSVCEGLVLN